MNEHNYILFTACEQFPPSYRESAELQAHLLAEDFRARHPAWHIATDFPSHGLPAGWGPDECVSADAPRKRYDGFVAFLPRGSALHLRLAGELSLTCAYNGLLFYLVVLDDDLACLEEPLSPLEDI